MNSCRFICASPLWALIIGNDILLQTHFKYELIREWKWILYPPTYFNGNKPVSKRARKLISINFQCTDGTVHNLAELPFLNVFHSKISTLSDTSDGYIGPAVGRTKIRTSTSRVSWLLSFCTSSFGVLQPFCVVVNDLGVQIRTMIEWLRFRGGSSVQ